MTSAQAFYFVPSSGTGGPIEDDRLQHCIDRHRIKLRRPRLMQVSDERPWADRDLVLELMFGWANRVHLRAAADALREGRRVWFYWPREGAIELVDADRLASHRRLWLYVHLRHAASAARHHPLQSIYAKLPESLQPVARTAYRMLLGRSAKLAHYRREEARRAVARYSDQIRALAETASPADFRLDEVPDAGRRLPGLGLYVRTDFWAKISTGGSYGHTCYVAKELSLTTERLLCMMPHRYVLLDDLGIAQQVMPDTGTSTSEVALIKANEHYYALLKRQIESERPAYIYERLCLGNFAAARLCAEHSIPFVAEYNGSELSMSRSFGESAYEHEGFFLAAEDAAFRQATAISVVSDAVCEDLLRRGVPRSKILVNPNGVDLDAYAPLPDAHRQELRQELGYANEHRVVGFIGTFGGWHGIDVLAEALPMICNAEPRVRFLLIGDGNFRNLIDDAIRMHGLKSQVHCTGRVPHQEGARLMAACDIYASPHSSHMVDSRFFGSPTKLFEYMALAGGIVASDLEQIGEVLSPALRVEDLGQPPPEIVDQRAILCAPGSAQEFAQAVLFLARHPDVCRALGRNAREAAARHFSWRRHVERLWTFVAHGAAHDGGIE
jgi:glycosyltransferase involved in cell wall biosynthesis